MILCANLIRQSSPWSASCGLSPSPLPMVSQPTSRLRAAATLRHMSASTLVRVFAVPFSRMSSSSVENSSVEGSASSERNLAGEVDAFVADVHAGAGDNFADLVLRLPAEGGVTFQSDVGHSSPPPVPIVLDCRWWVCPGVRPLTRVWETFVGVPIGSSLFDA